MNKLRQFYILALVLSTINSYGQTWQWVNTIKNSVSGEPLNRRGGISVDSEGNSYITGEFNGTANFSGTTVTSEESTFYIAKYNAEGILQWVQKSSPSTSGIDIVTDAEGNSYVTGTIGGTNRTQTIFIAKYNNNGGLVWTRQASTASTYFPCSNTVRYLEVSDITLDNANNIIIAGNANHSVNFGNGVAQSDDVDCMNHSTYFVKYDSNGNIVYGKFIPDFGSRDIRVGTDKEGNIFISGLYNKNISFSDNNTFSHPDSEDHSLFFLAKYTSNGSFSWAKDGQVSNGSNFNLSDLAVDRDGNSYITGYSIENIIFNGVTINTESNTLFLLKTNTNGTVQGAKLFKSGGYQSPKIATDKAGNLYISFESGGGFTFDTFISPNLEFGSYIGKLDTDGNAEWVARSHENTVRDLAIDNEGNVLNIGSFSGSRYAFGSFSGENGGFNSFDTYITKLSPVKLSLTSASSYTGKAGDDITLNGTGFNPVATANTVHFGVVKALVKSASPTSLVVTVPASATYAPISVTAWGQTATTKRKFIPVFTDTGDIVSSSFNSKISLDNLTQLNSELKLADLNGDGKIDLLLNSGGNYITTVKNVTASNTINAASFSPRESFYTGDSRVTSQEIVDIDSDGKLDILSNSWRVNNDVSHIRIYKNKEGDEITSSDFTLGSFSTGGSFFNNKVVAAYSDFNNDNRTDVVVSNKLQNRVSVFQNYLYSDNNGFYGNVFRDKVDIATDNGPVQVEAGDINNDGKLDIVTGNLNNISILVNQNTSYAIGEGSFANPVNLPNVTPNLLKLADVDGDGKLDIVYTAANAFVNVLRNVSTTSSITASSFAAPVFIGVSATPTDLEIADLNGDGKLDIVIVGTAISVLQNISSSGNISTTSFKAAVNYATDTAPGNSAATTSTDVAIGDVDGDGKPEIVATTNGTNPYVGVVSIYKNLVGACDPVLAQAGEDKTACFGSTVTLGAAAKTGVTYVWAVTPAIAGFSSSLANPIISIPAAGSGTTYTFKVTATEGQCISEDEVVVTVGTCTGFTESKLASNLLVYPNPAKSDLIIELPLPAATALTLRFLDAQGQKLYEQEYAPVSGEFKQVLNLRNKASGMYLLQVVLEDGVITRRVVVE